MLVMTVHGILMHHHPGMLMNGHRTHVLLHNKSMPMPSD